MFIHAFQMNDFYLIQFRFVLYLFFLFLLNLNDIVHSWPVPEDCVILFVVFI